MFIHLFRLLAPQNQYNIHSGANFVVKNCKTCHFKSVYVQDN